MAPRAVAVISQVALQMMLMVWGVLKAVISLKSSASKSAFVSRPQRSMSM